MRLQCWDPRRQPTRHCSRLTEAAGPPQAQAAPLASGLQMRTGEPSKSLSQKKSDVNRLSLLHAVLLLIKKWWRQSFLPPTPAKDSRGSDVYNQSTSENATDKQEIRSRTTELQHETQTFSAREVQPSAKRIRAEYTHKNWTRPECTPAASCHGVSSTFHFQKKRKAGGAGRWSAKSHTHSEAWPHRSRPKSRS